MDNNFCVGIDFGTDSVRALLVNAENGKEFATSVFEYPRWKKGLYCNPEAKQFRQHPLDYLEGLEYTIKDLILKFSDSRSKIKAISIDSTGSTPVAVDKYGNPLALLPEFQDDPDAMFILWKDYSSAEEADQINTLCKSWTIDYSKYTGGVCSAEWFWPKILHVIKNNRRIADVAYSWVELCDWIPALLTGETNPLHIKRSRGAAGHKAMWHPEWDGLPSTEFLSKLHPKMGIFKDRLYSNTFTSDIAAGTLSRNWAEKLGLSEYMTVGVGALDAHFGFVGGQIEPYKFTKVIGTSSTDMIVAPLQDIGNSQIPGICGQVNGSVIPGMISLEAGQSAFGDIYAWFRDLLLWPIKNLQHCESEYQTNNSESSLIEILSNAAALIPPGKSHIIALDWLNGRRSPYANPYLEGAIMGLTIGTDASTIFKGLIEATAFGSKKIIERFKEAKIPMSEEIIAMGGVARKSTIAMQTLSDVLNRPVKIVRSENACALGAAMFAGVVAGIYKNVIEAQKHLGSGFDVIYNPIPENVRVYKKLYVKYTKLSNFIEKF
jgi:L-ribulokinase